MIIYETTSLLDSVKKDNILIPIVVNTYGRWEINENSSIPLGNYFTKAKNSYLKWSREKWDTKREIPFDMGETQIVQCETDRFPTLYIANMVYQNGLFNPNLNIAAFDRCVSSVMRFCDDNNLIIYATKQDFGPGEWKDKEEILNAYPNEIHIFENL